jgi:uncharacterized membrane protein
VCLFVLASAPLAVVRPGWLLLALPGLVLAALSSYESQRELQAHYAVQAVPLILLALLIAARSAVERVRPEFLAPAIILPALAGFFCLSPLSPFSAGEASPSQRHRDALDAAVAMVPADAPVSAQSAIVPRLSQRPLIEEFPGRGSQVDWVVVDAFGSRSTGSLDAGFWDALSQLRTQFVLVWEQDGVEVYRNPLTTFR